MQADIILKEFFEDNARFSDLFNGVLFQGKQVLTPEDLVAEDSDSSTIAAHKEIREPVAKRRDILKKGRHGVHYLLFGIENQKKLHPAMPVRCMLYDAIGYNKELRQKEKRNRASGKKDYEFLSGLKLTDKLTPIVTLVVYYGEEPWRGPKDLYGMMELPPGFQKVVPNYKMNLLEVRASGRYRFRNEDVRNAFEVSRAIYDGNLGIISDRNISYDAAQAAAAITDSYGLLKSMEKSRGEEVNMSKALDRILENQRTEGKQEGRKEGRKEGLREGRLKTLLSFLESGFDLEEVVRIAKVTPEEKKALLEKLPK